MNSGLSSLLSQNLHCNKITEDHWVVHSTFKLRSPACSISLFGRTSDKQAMAAQSPKMWGGMIAVLSNQETPTRRLVNVLGDLVFLSQIKEKNLVKDLSEDR